ncbi:hypothetical protein Aeqsu_0629 [Aequorivita sublithincola DSM 14238]|uniref:Uncharacterized protein n=1 Tax=Aequorivita sublithincola (strain DSM 14238 / LMG 21431 / ACAM 643 / 9-3) TaxID=746697 RepID=I3YT20_AEQSU|nr:hypothetical protein [Aequorivita sublithincola]AFL80138.1 hypothetical protein Aeqsu_0629 [Aequorivita sublithincola DSM 14238]
MLIQVSYNDKEITRKINEELGKPFNIKERFKMRGIGSPKLILTETSIQISNLMNLDNNRNVCNIEMRPKGIIVGFRSKLNSYALIIPYYKLVVYKGKAEEYSIYKDDYFLKIEAKAKDKSVHSFVKKVMEAKNAAAPDRLEEL